jgi:hypothetical protein
MNKFIAYFDLLGFEEFIAKNSIDDQKTALGVVFHTIECSLSGGKVLNTDIGVVADISNAQINCLNFSDTIVFWTNDESTYSLINLLKVVHDFNSKMILYVFPIRGAVTFGEIFHTNYREASNQNTLYNVNSVYGKGIIEAYRKSEMQNWAGTVIDNTIIEELKLRKIEVDTFLKPFAKKYQVPYKDLNVQKSDEYTLCPVEEKIGNEFFNNCQKSIERNFSNYNKDVSQASVKIKLATTIKFLESFK